MLEHERRRAVVEHVEGGAGARVDLEEPPALALDQQVGAGETRQAGGAHQPLGGLARGREDGGGERARLVPAAGERPGVAEGPRRRGRLPLLCERQDGDAGAVGEKAEGEGAARHLGLEVVPGRHGSGRAGADMRAAAAARPLDEPRARIGDRIETDGGMRDREARAQRREAERVLEGGDRGGAGAEQRIMLPDLGNEPRRPLETAAEDDAENGTLRRGGEGGEPRQHRLAVTGSRAEPAGQRPVAFREGERVLVAEQVEHERAQPRPPRGLGQGPAGLGRDQDRGPLGRAQRRAQPAISTASV